MTSFSYKISTAERGEHSTQFQTQEAAWNRVGSGSGPKARPRRVSAWRCQGAPVGPECPRPPSPAPVTSGPGGLVAAGRENLPSMGVLGSGRLANTTSTYSNCSRSREAFRPGGRSQRGPSPSAQTFRGPRDRRLREQEKRETRPMAPGAAGLCGDTCEMGPT